MGGVGVIHMINERPAVKTPMVVTTRKSLKSSDHREMVAGADDIGLSSGNSSVSVTVIRSGCFTSSTMLCSSMLG